MTPHRRTSEMLAMMAAPPTRGLKHLLDRVLRMLTMTDTTLAEFLSSTTLLAIGVILALPGDSLSPQVPLFVVMLRFAPESSWAALFVCLGSFQSAANLSRDLRARRYAAFCAFVFFGFVGFLGASVTPISLFGACLKVHALGQAVVYLQLGLHGYSPKERGAR